MQTGKLKKQSNILKSLKVCTLPSICIKTFFLITPNLVQNKKRASFHAFASNASDTQWII